MVESLWEKIKRIDKFAVVKHYHPDYKVNAWIFNLTLVVIIGLTFVLFSQYNWSMEEQIYLKCNLEAGCENPFYIEYYNNRNLDSSLCPDKELCALYYLPYGFVYGKEPTFLQKNYEMLFFFLMAFAVLLNHFLYNRDFFEVDKDE